MKKGRPEWNVNQPPDQEIMSDLPPALESMIERSEPKSDPAVKGAHFEEVPGQLSRFRPLYEAPLHDR